MINTNMTHIDREAKTFAVDASEVEYHGSYCRAYDDACDLGIELMSNKTGCVAVFVENNRAYDSEGDIQYVEYIPTMSALHMNPNLDGWKLIVFND